ncbi:hypothetical protein GCM10009821_06540 [Aeromicrobium halocynthiae]|uniref:Uncharacterized protein n=1 Tax=Aeromicrobium halocynthiae TaxID=560557 RepID=A0ABN2VST8_9ACTN
MRVGVDVGERFGEGVVEDLAEVPRGAHRDVVDETGQVEAGRRQAAARVELGQPVELLPQGVATDVKAALQVLRAGVHGHQPATVVAGVGAPCPRAGCI